MLRRLLLPVLAMLALVAPLPACADYIVRDGQSTPQQQTFGSFSLNGVLFPKHVMVDPTTGAAIGVPANPAFTVQLPFRPIPGTTVCVTAGPTPTGAGKLPLAANGVIAQGAATSYRVRAPGTNGSQVTWILTTDATKTPNIPTPYAADGTGGTAGDKSMDAGSVEVMGLTVAQQTSLAAGTLYLSVVTPSGGSGVLCVTPGNGA